MGRRKLNGIIWAFAGLTVLVLALMLSGLLRRPGTITLPDPNTAPEQSGGEPESGVLTVVEVMPETVQDAIATLARPRRYRRTVTAEQIWSGGSGTAETSVAVLGAWTRTDRTMPDGRVRHTITGPEIVYIWYNTEPDVYSAPAGSVTADHEQPIPTYEDVLELDPERILAADYREDASGVPCIYVEALDGEYVLRYWVSVESGLLTAAEKLLGEDVVYRMAAQALGTEPTAEDMTLPDGTVLAEEP